MRIAFDLDGVICTLRGVGETYEEVKPLPGAIKRLKALREAGHTIIIFTARNMGSTKGNVGKALNRIGKVTFDWLSANDVEFDEIYFGKPSADIYIDDKGWRFQSWDDLTDDFLSAKSSTA